MNKKIYRFLPIIYPEPRFSLGELLNWGGIVLIVVPGILFWFFKSKGPKWLLVCFLLLIILGIIILIWPEWFIKFYLLINPGPKPCIGCPVPAGY